MIRRGSRGRAGITLTEILISIMIMGVGLISLATLFPLGLMRLRSAAVRTRSAFLVESAEAEIATRNLLARDSFAPPTSPWYTAGTVYDPWVQDTPSFGANWTDGAFRGPGGSGVGAPPATQVANPFPEPGLPVAYDPLWRTTTGLYLNTTEARFASGIGRLRPDPNPSGSPLPSAHGLQRITNFNPGNYITVDPIVDPTGYATQYDTIFLPKVASIFVSPDDILFQSSTGATGAVGSASPIVPDMSAGLVSDWMYTWMFTGQRSSATNPMAYNGDIVIFHGRPLAPDGAFAAGELVVEAVFGYSTNAPAGPAGVAGYGIGADRIVLLRWPATIPDPEVRVGSWIADVTYEREKNVDLNRQAVAKAEENAANLAGLNFTSYPNQRCNWYQVVKKSDVQTADAYTGDGGPYRSMTVVVNTPLKAKTLMNPGVNPVQPYHVNAALVSRYVVNVFPRSFTTR